MYYQPLCKPSPNLLFTSSQLDSSLSLLPLPHSALHGPSVSPGHSSLHSGKVLIKCGKFEGAFSFRFIFFLLWVECSHGCSNSKEYSCFHINVLRLILRIPEEIDFQQNLWVISSGHFLQVLLL